jgi:hypothetical protein
VRYHQRAWRLAPSYVCQRHGIEWGEPVCQFTPGQALDEALGELLLQTVTPLSLDVALAVETELKARLDGAERLRQARCERLRYEADLARRRYMHVDPENRLVADELEREWNGKLRAHQEAVDEHTRRRQAEERLVTEEQQTKIRSLATDFPRLWRDPRTPQRERKRMVRLIVEDVTLTKTDQVIAQVRFRGGTTNTLLLPRPSPAWKLRKTPTAVVAEIDRLLEAHTPAAIAEILNRQGMRSGEGQTFHRRLIQRIVKNYGLKSRHARLRERGLLTCEELAERFGISQATVKTWRQAGLLETRIYNDKNETLYCPPGDDAPVKGQHKGLTRNHCTCKVTSNGAQEVQYEA